MYKSSNWDILEMSIDDQNKSTIKVYTGRINEYDISNVQLLYKGLLYTPGIVLILRIDEELFGSVQEIRENREWKFSQDVFKHVANILNIRRDELPVNFNHTLRLSVINSVKTRIMPSINELDPSELTDFSEVYITEISADRLGSVVIERLISQKDDFQITPVPQPHTYEYYVGNKKRTIPNWRIMQ